MERETLPRGCVQLPEWTKRQLPTSRCAPWEIRTPFAAPNLHSARSWCLTAIHSRLTKSSVFSRRAGRGGRTLPCTFGFQHDPQPDGRVPRSPLGKITQDPFGDAAWLPGAFRFDRDIEDRLDTIGQLSARLQTNARANLLAGANGRGETHAIQAVVDGLAHVPRQLDCLPHEMAHQG